MSKTPMMQQYDKAKAACGNALLLFRMGDFYELFHDDARVAAKTLGLTLTSRDKKGKDATPMAGFPYHQLDGYMAKLIKQGFRVAVCEQVEDPKKAKGLVKREISQIVSPGTITDQALLDPSESNFLVAIVQPHSKSTRGQASNSRLSSSENNLFGIAWAEISSGKFFTTCVSRDNLNDLLARIGASEVLVTESLDNEVRDAISDSAMVTVRPDWSFGLQVTTEALKKQFKVSVLDGFGIQEFGDQAVRAAGAVIEYLRETQKTSLDHFDKVLPFRPSQFVEIDAATWRSLEISRTIRNNSRDGSLLDVIDRCKTPMGSRILGEWLAAPLTNLEDIKLRQSAVAELTQSQKLRDGIRDYLKDVYDLQRLLARVATGRTTPRDMSFVSRTLAALPKMKSILEGCKSKLLAQMQADLDLCVDLHSELIKALVDPCPVTIKDGGFIAEGYHAKLDEFRNLATGGKQWIAQYQKTVCEQTGISTLKVGFNKVFGYYLEATNTHRDKIPDNFIRKQTLKNAERYITPELKEYEEKVLSADTQVQELEQELLHQLRELVRTHTKRLKANSEIIAALDAVTGLAQLAIEQSYCRPEIADDGLLEIIEGRHPVLDIIEPLGAFVPNDTSINCDSKYVHLITGPNMAGKSTYIRQVALIALLAQVGSFVPAKSARIGIVDRIFARVGASDELSRGQSTFMVEMTETARILNTASNRSLVILDEIGRGTSTYDGVSLAWSIVEYLHDQIGCRTLFATHYHELTELESSLQGVINYNVLVQEWQEKIVFLHKIAMGSADKSYGIQVAKLAGVPNWVNLRAEQILEKLESSNDVDKNREAIKSTESSSSEIQLTMFGPMEDHPLIEKIKSLDTNNLTPLSALELLHDWNHELADAKQNSKAKIQSEK